MHGHAIAHTVLAVAGGPFVACAPLLIFCGLLAPLGRGARPFDEVRRTAWWRAEPRRRRAGNMWQVDSPLGLNSIELALIAELNLERARAHEEVANDPDTRHETRAAAAQEAREWRARAAVFQMEAQRQSAQPIVPGVQASDGALEPAYTGPDRRKQARRRQTRRMTAMSWARDRRDRHAAGDRRRGDRRRLELAPR
jgi:hypothetical protein